MCIACRLGATQAKLATPSAPGDLVIAGMAHTLLHMSGQRIMALCADHQRLLEMIIVHQPVVPLVEAAIPLVNTRAPKSPNN